MDSGFEILTLRQSIDRVQSDIDSALPGADSRLRRRATRALGIAVGGMSWLLQKFGLSISNEILPDFASAAGVRRWRKMWGLPEVPGVRADGPTRFTGTPAQPVPLGRELVRADGTEYLTTVADVIGGGGFADINVQAVEAGEAGNVDAGVTLYLSSPLSGVDTETTVQSPGVEGGLDDEDTEAERRRVLVRTGTPPQGGAVADFVQWALEAVANTRAVYVEPNEPVLGEVTVRFIVEPPDGDPANALPSTAELEAVRLFIRGDPAASPFPFADAAAPAPLIGDRVTVPALTGQAVDVEVTDLTPDTQEVRDAVRVSIEAMMLQKAVPNGDGLLKESHFWGAIDAAPGEESHELTGIDGGAPADVAIVINQFPFLDNLVFLP